MDLISSERDVCSAHVAGGRRRASRINTALLFLDEGLTSMALFLRVYQCLSGFRDHKVKDQTGSYCDPKYGNQPAPDRQVFKWTCTHYLQ